VEFDNLKYGNLSVLLVLEFGSCHSFGVAVGLRGYGMCQMRGQVEAQSS